MIKNYFSLVKFSHTVFALPFALIGFTMGVFKVGHFDFWLLIKVILCMVFARNAAMAYNRYLDRDIDSLNPRTLNREIPAGIMKPQTVLYFVIINCVLFIITCYFINRICLYLSPLALLIILGYSFTKRFTVLCHFILGLGLALAPVGAYMAVTATFSMITILLGIVVLCWVSGFDIIYSIQDDNFDRTQNLYSIPASLGRKGALRLSALIHFICALLLCISVVMIRQTYPETGLLLYVATAIFLIMLVYQHLIITADDLRRVNLAFMTTNGLASVVFGSLVIIDFFV